MVQSTIIRTIAPGGIQSVLGPRRRTTETGSSLIHRSRPTATTRSPTRSPRSMVAPPLIHAVPVPDPRCGDHRAVAAHVRPRRAHVPITVVVSNRRTPERRGALYKSAAGILRVGHADAVYAVPAKSGRAVRVLVHLHTRGCPVRQGHLPGGCDHRERPRRPSGGQHPQCGAPGSAARRQLTDATWEEWAAGVQPPTPHTVAPPGAPQATAVQPPCRRCFPRAGRSIC